MKTNRRDILRGAALTGVVAGAGALSACSESAKAPSSADEVGDKITTRTIAEAEKLQGISLTPAEREQMLGDLEGKLEALARLRAVDMPNTDAPALLFDPKLPGKSVRSQKNILVLSKVENPLPDKDADIAFASVVEQGEWLRAGAISATRLTEIYLKRIEQYDAKLRAFITVTPAIARLQAAKADKDFAAGRVRSALQGIAYGLKDLVDTKDVKTTWGATPYKTRTPDHDAQIVRKLHRAGAVMLGKTSCGALAYGDQWFDARTKNPWNIKEGSSGSSAGSASATAAGLCSFGIGTETLGSIISPSERCGATGLRPTFGRVSRHGVMALCWSLDKIGAICRSVEDTAAVLAAMNGYDADDPSTARIGFTYDSAVDVSGMTVGYVPAWFEEGDAADRAGLEALRGLGVTVKEFSWPELSFDALIEIVLVESAAAFADLTLSGRDDELVWQEPQAWPNTWRAARFISAVDYVQIDRLRRKLMQDVRSAFEGFDALIGPHYAGGALLATNMTGHPQLALRAGFAQKPNRTLATSEPVEGAETFRVPRGISLWGDLFQEGKIIALGAAMEKALGVSGERPPGF
ncbi:MAG: amidase [Alphaproteobacteria bacterium]|nr:amidase [Alphaproteobacteria bacterium]